MKDKTVIIILGPTAVGKTSIAIDVAAHFKTQIISADSRQCFKELNIGVAKPSPKQLKLVKHYFINSHSIEQEVNAGVFEKYALNAVEEIFHPHDVAIMAGGTGLYIKAFCEGMDEMPAVPVHLRDKIISTYKSKGIEWLQNEVKEKDPLYFASGEILNPQRLMRALEIKLFTGQSIREYQQQKPVQRDFNIIKIGIELSREELYHNINRRVDEMMDNGLLDEVKGLLPFRNLNALQTVGYAELFAYLEGKTSLDKAADFIKQNTRHYAKRQLTWFKKDQSIKWFLPVQSKNIIEYCNTL